MSGATAGDPLASAAGTVGIFGLHVTVAQIILVMLAVSVLLILGYRVATRNRRFEGGTRS